MCRFLRCSGRGLYQHGGASLRPLKTPKGSMSQPDPHKRQGEHKRGGGRGEDKHGTEGAQIRQGGRAQTQRGEAPRARDTAGRSRTDRTTAGTEGAATGRRRSTTHRQAPTRAPKKLRITSNFTNLQVCQIQVMRPIQYLKPAARVFLGALKPNKHARHGSPVPDNGHKGSDDRGGRAGGPPGSPNRGSTNGPTNTRRVTGRARTRQGRSRPTGRTDGDRKNPPTADKHNQTAVSRPRLAVRPRSGPTQAADLSRPLRSTEGARGEAIGAAAPPLTRDERDGGPILLR